MIYFQVQGDYIKLDQLLKAVGIADSGGHAKHLIVSGFVQVNGVETRERGKKIRVGDRVMCETEEIHIEA